MTLMGCRTSGRASQSRFSKMRPIFCRAPKIFKKTHPNLPLTKICLVWIINFPKKLKFPWARCRKQIFLETKLICRIIMKVCQLPNASPRFIYRKVLTSKLRSLSTEALVTPPVKKPKFGPRMAKIFAGEIRKNFWRDNLGKFPVTSQRPGKLV